MSSLLIKNARVALPDGNLHEGDLLCEAGHIARIAPTISVRADETLDASGQLLMPGVIDPQVHFREPGREHKEDLGSGSRAAVRGGVTSFLEMPNTDPPTTSQAALNDKLRRAAEKCVANYGFFIGATPDNLDAINTAGPVCGIKIFMGSSTGSLLVDRDEDLERIFATGHRLIAVHAEDEARIRARMPAFAGRHDVAAHSDMRDNTCAVLATERALALSHRYQRRLHILHLSTHEEVDLLRQNKPAWVTAEATPNHLLLNVADYERQGTRVQMNPPIRRPEDNASLWQGLRDGVVDFTATDHAPHTLEEKSQPWPASPSGMPGVETLLPAIFSEYASGRCTLAELLRWLCAGPATAYGLVGKGRIAEGEDADLVVVNDTDWREVRDEDMWTRVRWSPFAGRRLTGWPVQTIVGGQVVYDQGRLREGVRGTPLRYRHDSDTDSA